MSTNRRMLAPRGVAEGGDERGAVAVELALVAPLLLAVVCAIAAFGIAFNAHLRMTQGAREGVRILALNGTAADAITRTRDAVGRPGLGDAITVTPTACPATPTPTATAQIATSYTVSLPIPFYGGPPTVNLQARAVMRCGG